MSPQTGLSALKSGSMQSVLGRITHPSFSRPSARFARTLPFRVSTRNMSSLKPAWLQSVLDDAGPPPQLFAWNLSNINQMDSSHAGISKNMDDLNRRIFVLGVGNLGRLFASSLVQAPDRPPITLVVHRKELLTQWMAGEGIEILRNGQVENQKNFDIEWWTDIKPDHGPVREVLDGGRIRNLIVSTKASAALPQVDRLRRYLGRESTVAFAQNGMSKLWPPHGLTYTSERFETGNAPNFVTCITTHGVTSQGPFKSIHASLVDVVMGPVLLNPESAQESAYLTSQITQAPHLDGRSVPRAELWILQLEKLVVNCVINPLTAILRCKNGVLFTEPNGAIGRIIDQLLKETSEILQALVSHESSVEIVRDMQVSPASEQRLEGHESLANIQQSLRQRFAQDRLRELVDRVGHRVRENMSSMLQDAQAGKPTEIRDFNGWLIETAAFLDPSISVKGHQALVDLVESNKILEINQLISYFPDTASAS